MKNINVKQSIYSILISVFVTSFLMACTDNQKSTKMNIEKQKTTTVTVTMPRKPAKINPMIYGQMFEDCNDEIIYGGIVGKQGEPRPHIDEMLKPLQIPIMRWPGGTFIHEYHWENGIGPVDKRPVVDIQHWGGIENYRFGTDEFLQWCNKMGVEPYLNFNMANSPTGGTLEDALNWIEYTNGSTDTPYGNKRATNGHAAPYGVKYWGIGNENYGPWGVHNQETAAEYSARLQEWASAIRAKYSDLKLLAVGHTLDWDKTILLQNGTLIDMLTQHYYVFSQLKNDSILEPLSTLFAPAKMEAHLVELSSLLNDMNDKLERQANPITLSIDEWNNRHQVFSDDQFMFTRNDLRRQFDVAVTAGMLNAFIRQCAIVEMANYIFPVNGHGLVRTIGEDDGFRTPTYYLFELYRQMMIGEQMDIDIDGPGVNTSELDFFIEGDASEINLGDHALAFVDGAAVLANDGYINIALTNRSPDTAAEVKLNYPENYMPEKKWEITHPNINAFNSADNRDEITPREETLNSKQKTFEIAPCGWVLIRLKKV